MMRRGKPWMAVLAACLLLCGCLPVRQAGTPTAAVPQSSETAVPATVPKVSTTIPEATVQTTAAADPTTVPPEPKDSDFVRICDYIPDAVEDLKYATENNFTGQVIYDFSDVWLRYGTVKKLMGVQQILSEQGLNLKIWDAFRPTAAQFRLWEVCPDPTYVSNPNVGFSSHSRGNTVDITLVDDLGNELEMPTDFDDFSALADRNYADCDPEAAANALFLENLMTERGFQPYYGEWWHFTDADTYDVEKTFAP